MGSELVRYDGGKPSFTPAVATFSHAIGPLVGLSKLVAKVMASRVESKRLAIVEARDRYEHDERVQVTQLQAEAFERHSQRLYTAKLSEVEAIDRASQRETAALIRKIEAEFDAAVTSIRVEGGTRRYEIDRACAVELAKIDNALALGLRGLNDGRRRSDQVFRLAVQQNKIVEVELAELNFALRKMTNLIGGRNSAQAALAAATVPSLSSAIAVVVGNGVSPARALLGAISDDGRSRR